MNTCKTAYQALQTVVATDPDGVPGPKTDNAVARLRAAAIATPDAPWPVSQPVPAPPVSIVAGIDSVEPISATWIARGKELMGVAPAFIGRYFGPGRPATYQYVPAQENGPAAEADVKILLIAEQTNRVNGSTGLHDGIGNAQNIIQCFGVDYLASLGKEFYCFLDCEGSPDLTAEYWGAWSDAIITESQSLSGGRFTIRPAIYASQGDVATWKALASAMAAGAQCAGLWIASYETTSAGNLPIKPTWNANRANTSGIVVNAPLLLWQYAGGFDGSNFEALDPNSINPATDAAAFLARCVTPPGAIA